MSSPVMQLASGSIGRPYKIRVSHDRSGAHPSWFLTDISMQDKHTGEDFVVCSPPSNFASGGLRRFFATDRDDGETCREFVVAVSGHTPPFFRVFLCIIENSTLLVYVVIISNGEYKCQILV